MQNLLIPSKLSWMANMLSEDKCVCIVDAMKALYGSLNLDFVRNMAVESNFLSEIWQFVGKSYYF